ncbi:dynein light chain Tctex-type 4 [Microcaecilia unicolor]|uniref:Tctex1 domain-containing protein 4 n=1 Tax=Microcaecilia unicolor TaxID=1415580 RepID=A0A6P7YIL2_9AMPH|nr:tctex1 domain-containing protein 4 [Microcaecilia unicolor]XP_030062754.1 tctex1 domain-containing protein 4 [Microcaecilia unicolor]
MADKLLPLSQEALVQFNKTVAAEGTGARPRAGSFSTRRSSQSLEMPPRTLLRFRSMDSKPPDPSRRSSILSNPNAPFSRRSSVSMGMGKRLSLGPWMHHGRISFSGLPLYQPIMEIQYDNTYRMVPEEGCKFNASRVQQVLETILSSRLCNTTYNPVTTGQLAQSLTDLIRSTVKDLLPPRYKLVCNVIVGQMGNQGLRVASRCLWDHENDNFASATYTNTSLFAVAMAHGLYFQ